MKKLLTLLICLTTILMCGCSDDALSDILGRIRGKEKSNYCGTWVCDSVEKDGIRITAQKFDEMNNSDLSDYYFVLKIGGKCYDYLADGSVDECDWTVTKNGVFIDGLEFIAENDIIYADFPTYRVYYKKYSNSQDFPNKSFKKTKTAAKSNINPDFKKAMDDYERFIDNYIDFMERYAKANDNDPITALTMLQEYLKWLSDYAEAIDNINKLGESDLNEAELAYYLEVNLRIEKKLLSLVD